MVRRRRLPKCSYSSSSCADRAAVEAVRVGGVVLRLLRHADRVRHRDELLDEREDVLGREHTRVLGHLEAKPLVQLVAADLRQVVALRVEEQRAQEVACVVEGRRLTRPLLLEDLDQRLFLARGRVLLDRVAHEDRVLEELEDCLIRARVEHEAGRRVLRGKRPQERRDRQLALPVDAGVDDALLVDLELEPRAAARHQVGDEDLLGRVLRLHQVGAGAADELRDDHALGAVDDERPPLGHHREVAHEDPLLADLAGVLVDEADRHRERGLIRQVLLAALLDRDRRQAELVITELDCERSGVILDRRDVVDRLAEAFVQEPLEGLTLDVDQVGEVENVLETRERLARAWREDRLGQEEQPPLQAWRMRAKRKTAGKGVRAEPGCYVGELPSIGQATLQPQADLRRGSGKPTPPGYQGCQACRRPAALPPDDQRELAEDAANGARGQVGSREPEGVGAGLSRDPGQNDAGRLLERRGAGRVGEFLQRETRRQLLAVVDEASGGGRRRSRRPCRRGSPCRAPGGGRSLTRGSRLGSGRRPSRRAATTA